jgi:uncharacterized membrane-anchored protein
MATLHLPHLRRHGRAGLWGVLGATVVLYIFFAALADVDPSEAEVVTGAAITLAVLWFAHEWRRLWRLERRPGRR